MWSSVAWWAWSQPPWHEAFPGCWCRPCRPSAWLLGPRQSPREPRRAPSRAGSWRRRSATHLALSFPQTGSHGPRLGPQPLVRACCRPGLGGFRERDGRLPQLARSVGWGRGLGPRCLTRCVIRNPQLLNKCYLWCTETMLELSWDGNGVRGHRPSRRRAMRGPASRGSGRGHNHAGESGQAPV